MDRRTLFKSAAALLAASPLAAFAPVYRAGGGPVKPGPMHMTGERGPETLIGRNFKMSIADADGQFHEITTIRTITIAPCDRSQSGTSLWT